MRRPSLALAAYRLLTGAVEPLAPRLLAGRARRGKEDPERLGERLGRTIMRRPPGPLVWLHGASVGETQSFLPLVEALRHERPDLTLLVTSGTTTSAFLLARRLPRGVLHQYAPIDTPRVARRFVAHWRPDLVLFVESELWPNLLIEAKAGGARLALLGARLSDASARGWRRARRAAGVLLGGFDLILAQDRLSRTRIEALGGRVSGELDLKKAAAPLPCDEAELRRLKAAAGRRPVLLAASTHPGEEEIMAEVLAAAPAARRPLLVLAPRHPKRGASIAAALAARGLTVARRSADEPLTANVEAYVADTLGELGLFFRLAEVVVMGGSLTGGIGGHNPLEPARLGAAIVSGSDLANFREVYAGLRAAEAVRIVPDQQALTEAVIALLRHPADAHAMARRAQAWCERRGSHALAQTLAALDWLLPARPAP